MALIVTPRSNWASRAASSYAAPWASTPSPRARRGEPHVPTGPPGPPVHTAPLWPATPADEPKSRKCVLVPRPEDPTRVDVPVCNASNDTVPERPEAAPSAPARKPDAHRDKSWVGHTVGTPAP